MQYGVVYYEVLDYVVLWLLLFEGFSCGWLFRYGCLYKIVGAFVIHSFIN